MAHFPIYKNIFQSHFLPSQNQRYKVWHVFQTAIYIVCRHQTVHQEVCQETEALLVLVVYLQGRLIGLYYKKHKCIFSLRNNTVCKITTTKHIHENIGNSVAHYLIIIILLLILNMKNINFSSISKAIKADIIKMLIMSKCVPCTF